jgi:NADH:ubiquinone oxidoreductase subunit
MKELTTDSFYIWIQRLFVSEFHKKITKIDTRNTYSQAQLTNFQKKQKRF